MVALQASIGSLNDLVDRSRDAGHKPGKPIPRGLATPSEARVMVLVGLAIGLALAAPSGWPTLVVAAAGTGAGYAYDLWLKGTPASWLPFSVGIPLLPVFAWLGATGAVPPGLGLLVPLAAAAGAALAIANALADLERDRDAGTPTIVSRLGARTAWTMHAALQALVVAVAAGSMVVLGTPPALVLVAAVLTGLGAALLAGGTPGRRELGWELEAIGTGLLAVAWLAGIGTAAATPE
jgi:4-hydroxybenzoate polyprenyltransferase